MSFPGRIPRLVTVGDLDEALRLARQYGWRPIADRIRIGRRSTVEAAWNRTSLVRKNWSAVAAIRDHIRQVCTEDPRLDIADYVARTYFRDRRPIDGLSIGSGPGKNELEWAEKVTFRSLTGVDLAPQAVEHAIHAAAQSGHAELSFVCADMLKYDPGRERYDLVLSLHSLHHLRPAGVILERIAASLRPGGLLVVLEYVGPNRFQYTRTQLLEANRLLGTIPQRYRRHWRTGAVKNRVHSPGVIRMLLADPSEAADSESIVPSLDRWFEPVRVRSIGGTLLHPVFHDIGWNFADSDPEAQHIARACIGHEQKMLGDGRIGSDFLFGIYTAKGSAARPRGSL